jgi:eukaryotic-like serine/threonine-protein kinase
MGSPEGEPGIAHGERLITQSKIAYSFAVSVNEITMEQFRQFRANAQFAWERADPQCPANKISFDDAIQYCRWLSAKEGIPDEEMCYPADFAASNSVLPEQRLLRTGYRLPTEIEWEYTCRAGTTTPWFWGDDEEHLKAFAWFALNAGEQVRPVGSLRPNPLGIFDVLGNVAEWCHKSVPVGDYILRGGAYNQLSKSIRSAKRESQSKNGYSFTGFRIARTIVPKP